MHHIEIEIQEFKKKQNAVTSLELNYMGFKGLVTNVLQSKQPSEDSEALLRITDEIFKYLSIIKDSVPTKVSTNIIED